jgi:hypothetical protein
MFTNLLEFTEAYSFGILPHPFKNLCYICHLTIVAILILYCKISKQVRMASHSLVLAVDGVVETDGEVHHLIADRVHDFSHLAAGLRSKSRDFC